MSENPAAPDDRKDRDDEHVSDVPDDSATDASDTGADVPEDEDVPTPEDVRDELYGESSDPDLERPMESFDEGIVDLLSWGLDTETRARIYVRLRQRPNATSEELAEETGLYPSTVREAVAALHDEGIVERRKRRGAGGGNDPYEYTAIAPSDLVGKLAERIQDELNAVFDLGRSPDRDATGPTTDTATTTEPVTITVRDASDATEDDPVDEDLTGRDSADETGDHDPANESDDHDPTDDANGHDRTGDHGDA